MILFSKSYLRGIIFVFIIVIIGCNNRNQEVVDFVNNWKNKRIELPNISLMRNINNKNSLGILSKKTKILTFINGDCGSCINELKLWKELMKEINTTKTSFIYIIYSKNKLNTFKYLDSTIIKLNYPYFQDDQKQYLLKHKFPEDTRFQTFLLDVDNKVVLLGNPNYNQEIKSLYLKEIQKCLKE